MKQLLFVFITIIMIYIFLSQNSEQFGENDSRFASPIFVQTTGINLSNPIQVFDQFECIDKCHKNPECRLAVFNFISRDCYFSNSPKTIPTSNPMTAVIMAKIT